MRKFFSFIALILSISLISACSDSGINKGKDKPELDIPEESVPVRLFNIRVLQYSPRQDEIDLWQQYMKDKHDLEIEMIYIDQVRSSSGMQPVTMKTDTGVVVSDFSEFQKLSGLVYFNHIADMIKLKDAGLLVPVTDYIADIDEYNGMNQAIIKRFTDSEGNIWAFPGYWDVGLTHRIYNKEWIDKWGKDVPYDLNSFLEYARFVANEDPDGNHMNDTFILSYNESSFFSDFDDVFKAFGCYTNHRDTVVYNPHKGEYEIIVQNENFRNAIDFILQMRNEKLIMNDRLGYNGGTNEENFEFKVASDFGTGTVPQYFNGWEFGSHLIGEYDTKLKRLLTGFTGLAVLRDTDDVKGMIRSILAVTGSPIGYLDFDWGREGYNYEIMDDYIDAITFGENDSFRSPIGVRFGPLQGNMEETLVVQNGRVDRIPALSQFNEVEKARKLAEAHLYESDVVYSIDFEQYDNLIDKINGVLSFDVQDMVTEIIRSTKTVEDAIANFMTKVDEQDIPDQLALFNESIKPD